MEANAPATVEALRLELARLLGDRILAFEADDVPTIEVAADALYDVVKALRDEARPAFSFLTSLFGMHYPASGSRGEELGLQVLLLDLVGNQRLRVTTRFPITQPGLRSLTPLFPSANWMERESWDFFGIRFEGHPDLKRILNIESMTVFPMRKDFPLEDQSRDDKVDKMFGR